MVNPTQVDFLDALLFPQHSSSVSLGDRVDTTGEPSLEEVAGYESKGEAPEADIEQDGAGFGVGEEMRG